MAKKLITILLTLTIIACSSISIYADTETTPANGYETYTEAELISEPAEEPADEEEEEEIEAEAEDNKASDKEAKKEEADIAVKKAEKYKKGLASYIRYINPSVSKSKSLSMANQFIKKGKENKVDAKVLMAIAQNESTFYTNARSPYGYKGLMQTSDALARKYGYKPSSLYKASVSIDVGARYLGAMKKNFGTYTKAISAYAYGSGTVNSGNYSKAIANKILKTRKNITRYLERNNYI